MSFTNVYFNYGYNATMEKVAAKKKDEGMSTASKLGLGAAGLGAAGLGAYYGGDALSALGNAASNAGSLPMEGAGGYLGEALRGSGHGLRSAGEFMNENLKDPMQSAAQHAPEILDQAKQAILSASDSAQNYASKIPGMAEDAYGDVKDYAGQAGDAVKDYAGQAGEYGTNKMNEVSDYIKSLMGNPTPGSKQMFELDNLLKSQGPGFQDMVNSAPK